VQKKAREFMNWLAQVKPGSPKRPGFSIESYDLAGEIAEALAAAGTRVIDLPQMILPKKRSIESRASSSRRTRAKKVKSSDAP
jgi:hypothetical protein